MVGIINAGEYGRAIHDAWLRRQLIDIGETVVNNAFGAEPELDGSGQVEAAEQALFDLAAARRQRAGGFVSFERALTAGDRRARNAPSTAPATSPACPPGCATSTRRPAGCTPPTWWCWPGGRAWARPRWPPRSPSAPPARSPTEARAARPERGAEGGRRDLLAGNERRAARHPPAGRGSAHLRRPHPPRRYRPEGVRPLRAGQPRDRRPCRCTSTTRRRSRCRRCARAAGGSSAPRGWRWSWSITCN